MSVHSAFKESFSPVTLSFPQLSKSEEGGLSVTSYKLSNELFYFADLVPLYDALYLEISKIFKLDYSIEFLYIEGPRGRFTVKPGEAFYKDTESSDPQLWIGGNIPKYSIVMRNTDCVYMDKADARVSLQHAKNPMVFDIFVKALEAHLMKTHCVWYKRGAFAHPSTFSSEFATIDNLVLTEEDINYLNNAGVFASEKASAQVNDAIRKSALKYKPMTAIQADQLYAECVEKNMAETRDRIVRDIVTSERMMQLHKRLVALARENLPMYVKLCKSLKDNPWGYFEFDSRKTSTTQRALTITYRGDYRILQWELEHYDEFFEK